MAGLLALALPAVGHAKHVAAVGQHEREILAQVGGEDNVVPPVAGHHLAIPQARQRLEVEPQDLAYDRHLHQWVHRPDQVKVHRIAASPGRLADGLFLRFHPFHRLLRKIPLESASEINAVTYRPVLQYGGWGIKGASKKRAYNVRGNRGVRVNYPDGTHILIGSQRAEELLAAIETIAERKPNGG